MKSNFLLRKIATVAFRRKHNQYNLSKKAGILCMIRISAFLFSYEDTSKAYLLFLYEFMRLLGYVLECAGVSG